MIAHLCFYAGTSPQAPSSSRQAPPLPRAGQRAGQRQSFSAPSTSYMPPAESPASSLAGLYYILAQLCFLSAVHPLRAASMRLNP